MTSSMETFSALLAICAGNSPVPGEFPTQRPVTRGFDVFFDLSPNKRLSKQSWGWWLEMLSRPLWRNCNAHRQGTTVHTLSYVDVNTWAHLLHLWPVMLGIYQQPEDSGHKEPAMQSFGGFFVANTGKLFSKTVELLWNEMPLRPNGSVEIPVVIGVWRWHIFGIWFRWH